MKKNADSDNSALMPLLLALASGGGLVAANHADKPFYRYFTRQGSKFRPWANTMLAPDLLNGSGEGMMTRNWQRILREAGIGSNYIPENWSLDEYKKTIGELRNAKGVGSSLSSVLSESPGWLDSTVHHEGRDRVIKGLNFYLNGSGSKLSPKEKALVEKLFAAGKYDRLSIGTLRDLIKLDSTSLLHPDQITPNKSGIMFNAYRGFKGGWLPSNYFTHADNWYRTNLQDDVLNIGRYSDFQANYNGHTRWFIPGTKVYDKWQLRHPFTAKLLHGRDRKSLLSKILSLNPGADLSGKKLIFMDSGSIGPNNSQKIIDVVDALRGRNDVHILFQHGKDSFAPDLLGNNGVLSKLMSENPGLITPVERLKPDEMGKFINGSDLHITYGGSSSAGEAGSHLTPTAFSTDNRLNEGNLQFVRRTRNGFGGTKIGRLDNISTGLERELRLRGFVRPDGRLIMPSEPELKAMLDQVGGESGRRLSSNLGKRIVHRLVNDPTYLEKVRAHNKAVISNLLSDAVQGRRFSRENISAMRQYINAVRNSDRRMVDTVKALIKSEIMADDARRVSGFMGDLRGVFNRNGGKTLGSALRPLLSLRGMRNANLALGGLLTKNPIGRRIAVPLMALTGLAGIGGYAYKKHKDNNRSWLEKLIG